MSRKRSKPSSHKISTIGPDGKEESMEVAPQAKTIGEAMRQAVQDLGDVVIDDELAVSQLRDLAECYEQVTTAQAAYNARAEAAKVAKETLKSATDLLLEKVRTYTHPAPLPLFDRAQAESDIDRMIDSASR